MNESNNQFSNKMLYNVKEVAEIMQTNTSYVYKLIKAEELPAIKLGSFKVRHEALVNFFAANEGKDLTDPYNITAYPTLRMGGVC